jgi:hypothetical protein
MKLVHGTAGDDPPELFDLASDVSEERDLATAQPDQVRELQSLWNAWNDEQASPKPAKDKSKKKGKKGGKRARRKQAAAE